MVHTRSVTGEQPAHAGFGAIGAGDMDLDFADVGVVVLGPDGEVLASNGRACELMREQPAALSDCLHLLDEAGGASIEVASGGRVEARVYPIDGPLRSGRVVLLQDADAAQAGRAVLEQASRHRVFATFARDWAHELKGMLHILRINAALLAKLLQRESPAAAETTAKCLDAMPREVDRLDRFIDLIFDGGGDEQRSTFDAGALCQRIAHLIAPRAARQRVDVALQLDDRIKDVVGYPKRLKAALMNLVVNALEAMPEQGRLVIAASGDARTVTIRVCDSAPCPQPQLDPRAWRPHFVTTGRRTAIGLHVTRAIVDSHGGRIECVSNVPTGTCVEIALPAAATTEGRGHGSRIDR